MKRSMGRKCLLCGVLLAGALALTGCGEEPFELEDDERGIIVNYAAHIIAKYNVKQPEGYQYVYVPEEEEDGLQEEETDREPEDSDATPEEPADDSADDAQKPDDAAGDAQEEPSVTLTEALGISGLRAVYTGAELTDSYEAVVPEDGKRLLLLHVTLSNEGDQDVSLDMVSTLPKFRATINGLEETTAEITILPNDLSTWEGVVPAGGSADTVILFQIGNPQITSVEQLEMQVTAGDKTSRVVFL